MKTIFPTICRVLLTRMLNLLLLIGLFSQANASHFHGGNWFVSKSPGPGLEYDFVISTLWDRNFNWNFYHPLNPITPNVGDQINLNGNFPLHFGDGHSVSMVLIVKAVDLVNNLIACESYASHTYLTPAFYTVYFEGMHREGSLQNNADQLARMEASINIGTNSTPSVQVPGLPYYPNFTTLPAGQLSASMQLSAYDPDEVFYVFSLAPLGSFGPGSVQAPNLNVSPTGLLTLNTMATLPGQLYNAVIRVADNQGAYIQLDMIIMIVPCAPEQCNGSDDNCNGQIDEGFPDFDLDGAKNCIDIDDDNDGVPDPYDCEPLNKKKDKWLVCHNGNTLCIAKPAVRAHLKHGDQLGACNNNRGMEQAIIDIAEDFSLSIAPNPVISSAVITYELPLDSKVSIVLFDPQGKVISTLVDAERKAGQHNYILDSSRMGAGIYYYRMTAIAGDKRFVQGQKLVIVR